MAVMAAIWISDQKIQTNLAIFYLQDTWYFLPSFMSTGILVQEKKLRVDFGWPSWISNQNNFSYFLSKSCPNTANKILSQLAFRYRRRGAK